MNSKRTHKLNNDNIKDITTRYYLNKSTDNVNQICKEYDISKQYLYKLVKQKRSKELAKENINDNSLLFSKKIDDIIDQSLDLIQTKLNNGDIDKTTFKDLAIMIGTLYDKSRLEKNLSTENKAVEINIKIEK